MSVKKPKEVDSIYSGNSTKRSRIFDDISCSSIASARWTSILSCCWKRKSEKKLSLKDYNPNEYDYIVEKLVVKRVPLSLYATEEDFQELAEEKNYKDTSHGPFVGPAFKEMKDKQIYSVMPEMGSSFYFLKNKIRGDLSNKPSSKNFRFNKDDDDDLLDDDNVQAGPSNYDRNVSTQMFRNEEAKHAFLNQFSALHPDLKESERPPKDPLSLNLPLNKRSFAENISEIASAKKGPSSKPKKNKEKNKHGSSNVYITVSDTSKEISTVLGDEEIPTRDKYDRTSSFCRKIGSTSCLPYPQKLPKTHANELGEGKQIYQEEKSTHRPHKSSGKSKDRNSNTKPAALKGSQFITHRVSSSTQYSNDKTTELNPPELDSDLINAQKNYSKLSKPGDEESATADASNSFTSNDLKNESSTGTTLRWKIIIKHHQPTASQTASESASDFPENSMLPISSNDGFTRHKKINAHTESYNKIEPRKKINYDN